MIIKKDNNELSIKYVKYIISNFVIIVIEENNPHVLCRTEEPFYNYYSDKISYDYSGEVCEATIKNIKELLQDLGCNPAAGCYL